MPRTKELRRHPRFDLTAALICTLDRADSPQSVCVVRNLSIQGALLEFPANHWPGELEPGDGLALDDLAEGNGCLLRSQRGKVVWAYRRFLGVAFEEPLRASSEELGLWLMDHGLLFQD